MDLNLSSDEVDAFLQSKAEPRDRILTSEDVVISKVGRELYEKFFRGYTRKQWALDPSQLDASVTARVPTRTNKDDRYFTDTYQAMPMHGYTQMFEKMLTHPNIKIMLNTDYKEIINMIPHKSLIFTGPIDSFFDYCYGKLPYRSLDFQFETVEAEKCNQPVPLIIQTISYTRALPSLNTSLVRSTQKHLLCTNIQKMRAIRTILSRHRKMQRCTRNTSYWQQLLPTPIL